MSRTGLEIFDQTLNCTNIWIDDLADDLGCSRRRAWHALSAVLRALRDCLPLKLSVELGAGLPLLVRGAYFDRWRPIENEQKDMVFEEEVAEGLAGTTVAPMDAMAIVFDLLDQKLDAEIVLKTRRALPPEVRNLWPEPLSDRGPDGPPDKPRPRRSSANPGAHR